MINIQLPLAQLTNAYNSATFVISLHAQETIVWSLIWK